MDMTRTLDRFVRAHEQDYDRALSEIRAGRKRTHWMWYIFPQIEGLGRSAKADYYSIRGMDEARAFISDPYLGAHLREISEALLECEGDCAVWIFGNIDALKLRSSMTLFSYAASDNEVFVSVLSKFFGGSMCERTLELLGINQ